MQRIGIIAFGVNQSRQRQQALILEHQMRIEQAVRVEALYQPGTQQSCIEMQIEVAHEGDVAQFGMHIQIGRFAKSDARIAFPALGEQRAVALAWTPERPGTDLLRHALAPVLLLLVTLTMTGLFMLRGVICTTVQLRAANRAQYAIQHYPQAPATEEAMAILVKAYDALGLADLRDAADRVMQSNFPDSAYLKAGGVKKDVPWWRLWDPEW